MTKADLHGYLQERVGGLTKEVRVSDDLVLNAGSLEKGPDYRNIHPAAKIDGYYNTRRTHIGLNKDCPIPRAVDPPENGKVVSIPILGGLHHRYIRKAA
jgi:hypothetical protein